MKLLQNQKYQSLIAAIEQQKAYHADLKEDQLYFLTDKNDNYFIQMPLPASEVRFASAWEKSRETYHFDSHQASQIPHVADYNLIGAHRQVMGHNPWQYTFQMMQCVCEDSIATTPSANTLRARYSFEQCAVKFAEQVLTRKTRDGFEEGNPQNLSSYDNIHISSFFIDTLSHIVTSDDVGKQTDHAIHAEKLHRFRDSEIVMADALYDFAEDLVQHCDISLTKKIPKHTVKF